MNDSCTDQCGVAKARSGFSLIEVAVSTVIVGVMVVAALNTVAASRVSQQKANDQSGGFLLAQGLMNEILALSYWDPIAQGGMGPSASEAAVGNRSLFDDVDDCHGWSASPPQHKDGSIIAGFAGWKRRVAVDWVDPADLTSEQRSESGIKRVTVTVERNGIPSAELVAIRTQAWPDLLLD